ncbi:hypothetical protein GO986_09480 [Deinococcus sp. HMF7620]|uniref:Uncharacterized protein n=1 Tax=Deinococcus arboris TaxID=2682977 RepID=A0A7C9LNA1_9DEIO|nr:hypothetical protein [Deinococcus arboris]MVN86996.1 hypothetical protein [Deinococcus arboris]
MIEPNWTPALLARHEAARQARRIRTPMHSEWTWKAAQESEQEQMRIARYESADGACPAVRQFSGIRMTRLRLSHLRCPHWQVIVPLRRLA